uniref:C2H2-type domain-containing protein n=1 Tax=Rhodosorus marinus TaxID=101924 RepID=A0A7S0G2M0_9RHOD|mmetsp:Transcript_16192/g.23491  ORF Transcript_16192/g.23491 Transcript_16192/m.23491 type:complete len:237 (+) Transcript_16192:115-825(+)
MEGLRFDQPDFGWLWEDFDAMSDIQTFDSGDDGASAMHEDVSSAIVQFPDDVNIAQKQSERQSTELKQEQSPVDYNDLLLQALQCPMPEQEIDSAYASTLTPMTPASGRLGELPQLMDVKKNKQSQEEKGPASCAKNVLDLDDVGGSFSSTSEYNNDASSGETANCLERKGVNKKERVCHICGYEFMWPNRLRLHMRKHTNEKPLRCRNTGCNYRAKWNSGMAYHLKSHCKMAPKK